MAIDLTLNIQSTTAAVRTNTTVTKPTSTAENDMLVGVLYVEDDVTVTAPSGWTQIQTADHSGQAMDVTVWYKRAGASEGANYTWTHNSSYSQGLIQRVSGVITSGDPLDGTATTNQGTGTTGTMLGITTTAANSALFFILGWWDATKSGGQGSWSSPLTERSDLVQIAFASGVQAAAGASGNKTVTLSASGTDEWMALGFALKEQTAGTTIDLSSLPATATFTAVDPTVILGSLTLNLSALPATATFTAVDPTVVLGSLTLNLASLPAVATFTAVDPTVVLGSLTLNLASVPAVVTFTAVDPTVVAGGGTTLDLSSVPAVVTFTAVDPTVILGSLTLNLAAVPAAVTMTAVDPTVVLGSLTLNLASVPAIVTLTAVDPTVILGSLALNLSSVPAVVTFTAIDPTIILGSLTLNLASLPAVVIFTAIDPTVIGGATPDQPGFSVARDYRAVILVARDYRAAISMARDWLAAISVARDKRGS